MLDSESGKERLEAQETVLPEEKSNPLQMRIFNLFDPRAMNHPLTACPLCMLCFIIDLAVKKKRFFQHFLQMHCICPDIGKEIDLSNASSSLWQKRGMSWCVDSLEDAWDSSDSSNHALV